MLDFKNIKLIGSSHIAKASVKEIKEACVKLNPDIIALELDHTRLGTLVAEIDGKNSIKNNIKKGIMSKGKKKRRYNKSFSIIRKIGFNGFIFSLIGEYAEKKMGSIVGTKPGVDMLEAYKYAKKEKKMIALVDQDIKKTLKNLSNTITWKEKWQFVKDLFSAFVLKKPSGDIDIKEFEGFDLNEVPKDELVQKMMKQTKKHYPNLYKSLVEDRNNVMAKNLVILAKKYPENTILAVVGAGHEKEMGKLMKKMYSKVELPADKNPMVATKKIKVINDKNSFSYKIKVDN